ncbi:MAG: DNA-binding protein Alba [Methanosphaera sp. rholeuAM6]|nr:MAG: DNA-binding protein Alba [Methanosphaera sp. rholeuAM6]
MEENNQYEVIENKSDDENYIYIGKKPSMNYVLIINSRMLNGLDEMTIKARGKSISKAVDVAEIVTNRFITDANDDNIKISTEVIDRDDGSKTKVSSIEIVISRNN